MSSTRECDAARLLPLYEICAPAFCFHVTSLPFGISHYVKTELYCEVVKYSSVSLSNSRRRDPIDRKYPGSVFFVYVEHIFNVGFSQNVVTERYCEVHRVPGQSAEQEERLGDQVLQQPVRVLQAIIEL